MAKGFTDEEFTKYVDELKFTNLEDLCHFVRTYHDECVRKEDTDSLLKYSIIITRHGETFLRFTEMVLRLHREVK